MSNTKNSPTATSPSSKEGRLTDADLPAFPSAPKRARFGAAALETGRPAPFPGTPAAAGLPAVPATPADLQPATHLQTARPDSASELVTLHVSNLRVWEGNPRHVLDPDGIRELAASIKAIGQQNPIDVIPDPSAPGRYLIFGGQRRFTAISTENINGGLILARVRTDLPDMAAVFAAALMPQHTTEPLCDIDFAISLAKNTAEYSQKTLAEVLGRDKGEISKLRSIGEMPDTVLGYLKINSKKFSYPFAYLVRQVCDKVGESAALAYAGEIVTSGLTFQRATTRQKELLGEHVPKSRTAWDVQRLTGIGTIKLRPESGCAEISLTGLTVDQIVALNKAVHSVLKPGN